MPIITVAHVEKLVKRLMAPARACARKLRIKGSDPVEWDSRKRTRINRCLQGKKKRLLKMS
jgi:hypothetical protein